MAAVTALLALLCVAAVVAGTGSAGRKRVVGWYDARDEMMKNVPLGALDLSAYTIIVAESGPSILPNGTAHCGDDCCEGPLPSRYPRGRPHGREIAVAAAERAVGNVRAACLGRCGACVFVLLCTRHTGCSDCAGLARIPGARTR